MNTKKIISKKDISLIINVNNFSVEAAIFDHGNKDFFRALEIMETTNLIQDDINSLSDSKNLEKKLERTLRKIIEKSKGRIGFCLVVFSSPWFISQTHFVKIKKEKTFIFNSAELDKILKDENSSFVQRIKGDSDLNFIEAEIMKILLNGYEMRDPFGKKAKKVELRLYLSAIKNSLFGFINNFIGLNLGLSVLMKTRPSLFFLGFKDFLNFKEGAIFVDIGEDITEIILIKNDYIEEVTSFNKGRNFFIRRLMNAFNFSFDEAESVFSRYQKNILENRFKQNIDGILKDSQKEWQNSFRKLLKELSADHFLPQNLFFFSSKPVSKEFFISARDLSFNVQEISFKETSSYFNVSETDLKNYNPFLLIEAMFLGKLLKNLEK